MRKEKVYIKEGDVFGKLTAVKFLKPGRWPSEDYWLFNCSCGRQHKAQIHNIRQGQTTQCCSCASAYAGQVRSKLDSNGNKLTEHPLYYVWQAMISRCENTNNKDFPNYGGRGIKVCSRWKNLLSFAEDVGLPLTAQHSLDRKNNDGDYEPSNCRWATDVEQANNRRPRSCYRLSQA